MHRLVSQHIHSPIGGAVRLRERAWRLPAGICRHAAHRAQKPPFGKTLCLPHHPGENAHTRQAAVEIAEYFAGGRQCFTVVLHPVGSDFQRRVWAALRNIPYGTTTPTATRAVVAANGANTIAILTPCHRIIGKNGALTGYGGSIRRKAWLLAHERGG